MVVVQTSWDDGCESDVFVAELLRKHRLPGIFFIPTCGLQLTHKELVDLSKDFTIGGHTTTHPHDIKKLSREEKWAEIAENKAWVEKQIRFPVYWFAYPRGRVDDETTELVREAGFTHARLTHVGNISRSVDQYRIPTTVHAHRSRKEYNGEYWLDYAKRMFDRAWEQDGYYHLFGHSWEVDEQDLWQELEALFRYIRYGHQSD